MSEELDRRVAIEVMGEDKPRLRATWLGDISKDGNWFYRDWISGWKPLPFSTSLEHALGVWHKYREDWKKRHPYTALTLIIRHSPEWANPFEAHVNNSAKFPYVYGQTLEEAICNLLLALEEGEKE